MSHFSLSRLARSLFPASNPKSLFPDNAPAPSALLRIDPLTPDTRQAHALALFFDRAGFTHSSSIRETPDSPLKHSFETPESPSSRERHRLTYTPGRGPNAIHRFTLSIRPFPDPRARARSRCPSETVDFQINTAGKILAEHHDGTTSRHISSSLSPNALLQTVFRDWQVSDDPRFKNATPRSGLARFLPFT